MCKACDETADGQGVRCNRPDGRVSDVELDQRNRVRNLNTARSALARGDAQAAANALAGAVAAQRSLDGGPTAPVGDPAPTVEPHRDFIVSPSNISTASDRLVEINRRREQSGKPPLVMNVTRQHRPTGDPIMSLERATVRISGASQEELNEVSLGNVRTEPERRVKTFAVLEAACAATRLNGGKYVSVNEGPNSIPAQVNAYINAAPGSPERMRLEPTREDKRMAVNVRMWIRTQQPTTDYTKALRHSVSEDHMGLREAGTAASGIAGFQRHRARVEEMKARAAANPPQKVPGSEVREPMVVSPRPRGSRWLGTPGQQVRVVATVEKVVPVASDYSVSPRYLYVMRTPDGDLVRWMASSTQGMVEGDDVTLFGTIRAHSEFHGEKQTEMFYCKPMIHTARAS